MVKHGQAATPLGSFAASEMADGTRALVMIRPQGIRLARAGIGIEGYCIEARFIGDRVQCQLLFKGIDNPLMVRLDASGAPERGSTAMFCVDSGHVLVFAKGPSATI